MAQGPSDTILVAIRSRFGSGSPKSEIWILRIAVFGGGLCSLSTSSLTIEYCKCRVGQKHIFSVPYWFKCWRLEDKTGVHEIVQRVQNLNSCELLRTCWWKPFHFSLSDCINMVSWKCVVFWPTVYTVTVYIFSRWLSLLVLKGNILSFIQNVAVHCDHDCGKMRSIFIIFAVL